ncbi:VOC family protein [Yokenella regensburgei]
MVRGIEHIGITVSDLKQAENFFVNAFNAVVLYRLVPPDFPGKEITGDNMYPLNGFPVEMNVTGLSMLRLANGCNIELFQTSPSAQDHQANPATPGINHFSIYVDDILLAGERMRENGAKMFEGPSDCFAQEEGKGNQTWFGITTFGVLIELITLPAGLNYDEQSTAARWLPSS